LEQVQTQQISKPGDKKAVMESWGIPGPIIRRPNTVAPREGTDDSPNLSAEDGTENTESCMERRRTNAEGRQRTNMKDTMAAAVSSGNGEAMW